MRWRDVDSDPNGTRARALRAVRLDRAMRAAPGTGRIATLTATAQGRRVVDLGCVGHSVERVGTDGWLHAQVAAAAERCLGVDTFQPGVDRMRELGFDAITHDVGGPPDAVRERGPFDVMIAGEIIEHIEDLGVLIRFAQAVLEPEGTLVITTPNPYAPWRARAGQLGLVADNVDHICLVHPSGMAELCDRAGVELEAAWSTEWKDHAPRTVTRSAGEWARATSRRSPLRGERLRALNRSWQSPFEVVLAKGRESKGWLGETAIYVVRMSAPYEPAEAELATFSFATGWLSRR